MPFSHAFYWLPYGALLRRAAMLPHALLPLPIALLPGVLPRRAALPAVLPLLSFPPALSRSALSVPLLPAHGLPHVFLFCGRKDLRYGNGPCRASLSPLLVSALPIQKVLRGYHKAPRSSCRVHLLPAVLPALLPASRPLLS